MGSDIFNGAAAADREIVISRLIDAPRALVFEAWTQPGHLDQWWGPTGFRNETSAMQFRPGGVWTYLMHGPDGTDYPNYIRYDEIVPNERLVYAHGEFEDQPPHFHVTVTFADEAGKTRLTMRSIFPSKEARDFVVREFGAIEGGNQTLGRLASYVADLETARGEFTLTRVFPAPRALVFEAWTQPEHLARWWGRHGMVLTTCEADARDGGRFRFCMRASEGEDFWVAGEYHEVVPPARLVFTCGLTSHTPSHDALWTLTFIDEGEGTRMVLHQKLYGLDQAREGAKAGLVEGLERLDSLLRQLV